MGVRSRILVLLKFFYNLTLLRLQLKYHLKAHQIYFQIHKYCYFRAGENKSRQRNKLEVAKSLHTGEAQVLPFFKTFCVVSPHSYNINFLNFCKYDLSLFVIQYTVYD